VQIIFKSFLIISLLLFNIQTAEARLTPRMHGLDRVGVAISQDITTSCNNGAVFSYTTSSSTWGCDPTGGLATSFASGSVIFSDGSNLAEDNPGFTYVVGTGLSLDDSIFVTGNGRFDGGITDNLDVTSFDTQQRQLIASDGVDVIMLYTNAGFADYDDSQLQTSGKIFSGGTDDLGSKIGINPLLATDIGLGIQLASSATGDAIHITNDASAQLFAIEASLENRFPASNLDPIVFQPF